MRMDGPVCCPHLDDNGAAGLPGQHGGLRRSERLVSTAEHDEHISMATVQNTDPISVIRLRPSLVTDSICLAEDPSAALDAGAGCSEEAVMET